MYCEDFMTKVYLVTAESWLGGVDLVLPVLPVLPVLHGECVPVDSSSDAVSR